MLWRVAARNPLHPFTSMLANHEPPAIQLRTQFISILGEVPNCLSALQTLDISALNGGTPAALASMWSQVAKATMPVYPRRWAFIVARWTEASPLYLATLFNDVPRLMKAIELNGPIHEHDHFIIPEGYREDMRALLLDRIRAAPPALCKALILDEAGPFLRQISVVLADFEAATLLE